MVGEPWHTSHDNIVTLCRWLVEKQGHEAEDLLHVLEEPWKWEFEFKQATGQPTRADKVRQITDQICDAVKAAIQE